MATPNMLTTLLVNLHACFLSNFLYCFVNNGIKLADNAPTNWLVLNAPDLYLYGTLLQAEPFLMNDERVPLWERGVRQVINDLQQQDDKDRHSGSEMRVMNTSGYF